MSSFEPYNPDDRHLWSRLSRHAQDPGGCLTEQQLASYVDGRADGLLRDAIESHLALCSLCLSDLREIRALLAEGPAEERAVPDRLLAEAKGLVLGRHGARHAVSHRLARRSRAWWVEAARWSLAAAASVVICVLGYQAGQKSCAVQQEAAPDLVSEMSFGVLSSDGSDSEEEFFALALAERSS